MNIFKSFRLYTNLLKEHKDLLDKHLALQDSQIKTLKKYETTLQEHIYLQNQYKVTLDYLTFIGEKLHTLIDAVNNNQQPDVRKAILDIGFRYNNISFWFDSDTKSSKKEN
jgi:hypothetical protein